MSRKKRKINPFLCIVLALLLVCTVWWGAVRISAPDKIVSQTYKIGMQETADGNSKEFIEINYYSNKNNNGLEMLDVKFNYLLDETKTSLYSQGFQILPSEGSATIDLTASYSDPGKSEEIGETFNWPVRTVYRNLIYNKMHFENATVINYMSYDDYETPLLSTNPINIDTMFKIEIGDDIYGIKFRGDQVLGDDLYYLVGADTKEDAKDTFNLFTRTRLYTRHYRACNVELLISLLYDAVTALDHAENQSTVVEFGDMFDYYKYDSNDKTYSDTREIETSKIINDVKSYYSVRINTYADGVQKASDSLFNCVDGNANYNTTGNYSSSEYFIGRTVKTVTLNDFELIEDAELGHYYLALSDEFKQAYSKYVDRLVLDIQIDTDYLTEIGVTLNGYTADAFGDFEVWRSNIELEVLTNVVFN